jgi:hypothetical protein
LNQLLVLGKVMKKNIGILLLSISLILFQSVFPLYSQDKEKWDQVKQSFTQKCASKKVEERIQSTYELVNAIFPDVEEEAASLFVQQIVSETGLGGNNSKEANVNFSVLDFSVRGLKKITSDKAVDVIIKALKSSTINWRARYYLVKAIGGINNTKSITVLLDILKEKDSKVKIAVFDALAEFKTIEGVEAACKLLDNPEEPWELRIAAAQYCGSLNDQIILDSLINVLEGKNLEGRLRDELVKSLKKITGEDFGLKGSDWRRWLNDKTSAAARSDDTMAKVVYYGIKENSTRMIFILDVSGSMEWGAEWNEDANANKKQPNPAIFVGADGKPADKKLLGDLQAKKDEIDKITVKKRIDAAKRELANTIYALDPSVLFTIIFFESTVKIWKETLLPATVPNKLAALEEIAKQMASKGQTATFDVLESAFKIAESSGGKKIAFNKDGYVVEQQGGADTIFFVSDGVPTVGRVINTIDLVREINKLNETRRIKINTVGVGSPKGVPVDLLKKRPISAFLPDSQFLKDLATTTGGIFVDKTNK